MRKLKRIMCVLLAAAMILPQMPAKTASASDTSAVSTDVNMALNKSVVASNQAETPGSYAVDGDLNTRWGTWASGEPYGAPQSLTVDLEATSTIRKFVIYNETSETQKIREFKIDGSNDGVNYSVIYESEDNPTGFDLEYEVSLSEACNYRFVKITIEQLIDGATNCVSLREFEVWGTPGEVVHYEYEQFNPTTTTEGYTYLLEENAIANTWSTTGNDGPASYAFNGVSSNWWHTRWDGTNIESVTGNNDFSPTYGAVETFPAFSEVKNTRAWIGSSFGESITLGRFTYKGRTDSTNVHNNWIDQYAFYVANVTDGEPADTDWKLVSTGNFATNTENVVTLANPVQATHFRLMAFTRTYTDHVTASEIKIYKAMGVEDINLPKAGSISASDETITNEQPFAAGTAGSQNFRIPALIKLENGSLLAAADARWTGTNDWGGLDTIASVSTDDGQTWNYSFPIYFPDSASFTGKGMSTTAIDPILVQAADGKIWCIADMNPSGITTQDTNPGAGTGYVNINGEERLALTSSWANASTKPSDDITIYEYYVGDFTDGYAPVLERSDDTATEWVVDTWYNIYSLDENGAPVADLAQSQVDSETLIQQNAFYKDSILHVYNTGYIWAVTSEDGLSWSDPIILNTQVKRDDGQETALLVSPGQGLLTSNGDIIVGCYDTYSGENASFFYSTDNGETWARTNDVSVTSSENEIIELPDGTLRMFYRSETMQICYADATRTVADDGTVTYTMGSGVGTGISVSSNCNVSAIKLENTTLNDKPVVLVSAPEGPGSWNRVKGRIFVFTVNSDDNSMNHEYTYAVNESAFWYSCMTELNNKNIGMLWENSNGTMRYDEFDVNKVIGIEKDIELGVGEIYTESYVVDSTMEVTTEPDSEVAKVFVNESKDYRIPMYNHESNQASNLSSFSSEDNTGISLEEAEFTFNASGENWQIYNEAKQQYLANDSSAGSFFTGTQTAMNVESVDGDEGTEFRISKADATRYIMFYFNNMDFNGNSGGYNSSLSNGSQELVLLEKKATVSVDDIVPGYTRADSITSGNKYLISYIWEDGSVIVLYPTNGTANQTKLVGEIAWATMYNQDGTTLATDINIEDAEFSFTTGSSDNTWQILSVAKEKYLQNVVNTNILTDSANDIVVTAGSEEGSFYITDDSRYFVFYEKNKNFNAMSTAPHDWADGSYNLLLLEKQNSISSSDIIPGYAKITGVDQIDSAKTYLIAYDYDDVIYVLYPTEATIGNNITKVVKPATPVLTDKLVFKGIGDGTTTAVVNGVTYNITVATQPDDASRDIPVSVLAATAGSYQPDNDTEGNPAYVLDGNESTLWHTDWDGSEVGERWIQFEITGSYTVDGLRLLSRPQNINGVITGYEIWVGDDATFAAGTYEVITTGTWEDNGQSWKIASFEGRTVKYVRLVATESNNGFAAAIEVRLTGLDNKATLKEAVVQAEKALALNLQDNTVVDEKVAAANVVIANADATVDEINGAYEVLVQAMNEAQVVAREDETAGYTVTVVGGSITNFEIVDASVEGQKTVTNVPYDTKVMITADETDADGNAFVGWEVLGDIVSTERDYTFYVPNNVTITAVYEAVEVTPAATISNVTVTDMEDTSKVAIKFVGQLSYSQDDYELIEAGLKWLGSATKYDGLAVSTNGKTVPADEVNKSLQFSITLNGVPKTQAEESEKFVRGVVYMTLKDKVTGEVVTFYSAERKVLSGTTE